MAGTSRTKRTIRAADTSGLLYTTYEFIQRLRARGRVLRLDVRDALLQWAHTRTEAPVEWSADCPELQRHLSNLPPIDPGLVSLYRLCALLSPLQAYDIQYINLAIVLHSLTPMEIKNMYRYCYLEWMQHANQPDAPVWSRTPRQFSGLSVSELSHAWDAFVEEALGSPLQEKASMTFFFLNRLYSYLTPCG